MQIMNKAPTTLTVYLATGRDADGQDTYPVTGTSVKGWSVPATQEMRDDFGLTDASKVFTLQTTVAIVLRTKIVEGTNTYIVRSARTFKNMKGQLVGYEVAV